MSEIVAIVPCRAGSVGLPGKNRKRLGHLALWEIAAWQAIDAGASQVIISTDDPEILSRKPRPYKWIMHQRPDHLCKNESRVEDTVRCILDFCKAPVVVVLNPTHPFRFVGDIRVCISAVKGKDESCTGVVTDWHYTPKEGMRFKTLNRQAREPRYLVTGGIYAFQRDAFLENDTMMPCDTFWVCDDLSRVDIDGPLDYEYAKIVYDSLDKNLLSDYSMQERNKE